MQRGKDPLSDHEKSPRGDHSRLKHGEIARGVRFENERAKSRPFKEPFEHDSATEERTELGGNHREKWT